MKRLRLFEALGVELEYMIVDRGSMAARPVADRLLVEDGAVVSEVEKGEVSWSNELVSHVLELKTTDPAPSLAALEETFARHVREANAALAPLGAVLLGSGAHPFFDPHTETVIWPNEYNEVYRTYDRIFGCRGHGWSNLQSVHLNLPFDGDEEFGRLHAAVRLVLPIIPALAASTPYMDGEQVGPLDGRLHVYRHNQDRIPALVGSVVPEAVFTEQEYEDRIFRPIMAALEPHDPDRVLKKYFANSRGAIARFDRGSIEIRVIDVQECPAADLGILSLIVAVLRELVDERWSAWSDQRQWEERRLAKVFDGCVARAERHEITDEEYLRLFGLDGAAATAGELWRHLMGATRDAIPAAHAAAADHILDHGTLARRLVTTLGARPAMDDLRQVYAQLADCLQENRLFPGPRTT